MTPSLDSSRPRAAQAVHAARAAALTALLALASAAASSTAHGQGTAATSPPPAAATADRAALNSATFDTAWRLIYERHFDTTFNGVNWPALRTELAPRARAARSDDELRAVIRDMLGRLHESHFALIPREAADAMETAGAAKSGSASDGNASSGSGGGPGDAGLELRLVDGAFTVTRVAPNGAAALAGERTGWIVRRVDDTSLDSLLARVPREAGERHARLRATALAQLAFDGEAGTPVRVALVDGDGRALTRTLVRTPRRGESVKFGNLPPVAMRFERERLRAPGGATVGVLRFNIWMAAAARPFDEGVDEFRGTDGIVIDLRGNFGGVGAMVMGLSGHFLPQPVSLGTMHTRAGDLRFVANPRVVNTAGVRVVPYAGPVVVLVDALSASTSEIFAGGMQSVGRARIIGDTTAGEALPAMMQRLPNGDVLYHAFADFTTPAGARIEGHGIAPDELVPLTRRALLDDRDPPMDAALRWIAAEKRRRSSSTITPGGSAP